MTKFDTTEMHRTVAESRELRAKFVAMLPGADPVRREDLLRTITDLDRNIGDMEGRIAEFEQKLADFKRKHGHE